MKTELIAIPAFQDRVSPLMDVSDKYVIYEMEDGEIIQKIHISLNADDELRRIEKLKEIGVNTIICGAVSGFVAHMVGEKKIRLISMIHGPVEEVITLYLNDSLLPHRPWMRAYRNGKKQGNKCRTGKKKRRVRETGGEAI